MNLISANAHISKSGLSFHWIWSNVYLLITCVLEFGKSSGFKHLWNWDVGLLFVSFLSAFSQKLLSDMTISLQIISSNSTFLFDFKALKGSHLPQIDENNFFQYWHTNLQLQKTIV